MSKLSLSLFLALCIAQAPACKTNTVNETDEDMGTNSPDDLAMVGSELCQKPHSEQIAPMGGRITINSRESSSLAGATLEIPVGALSAGATIQLGCGDNLAVAADDELVLSPSLRLLPDGMTFEKPLTLTLPYNSNMVPPDAEVLLAATTGTQRELIGGSDLTVGPTTITASISHFSDYQVIARKPSTKSTKNIDVLFLMDNSPSMVEKQRGVIQTIGKFIRKLDDSGLDYHIGFATSDIGSTVGPGMPWGGAVGSCDTFEGDDGQLQIMPCTDRNTGTAEHRNACATYCTDPKFVPTDGKRYISRTSGVTNVPADMIVDPVTGKMVDNGPVRAFQCMGLVGDGGCGMEGQLEGARRALDGHRSDAAGFLRKDSLLAIVFLSDEDDCSVQMKRRSENNPANRDCATPDQNASYDCYNLDYRCLATDIQCDQPMNTPGAKTNCKERTNTRLEAVSKYTTFFRGLRAANRLFVAGIWALPTLSKGGKLNVTRGTGGTSTPFLNRASGADAACQYMTGSGVFGQAQLRLSAFAGSFTDAKQYSICDVDGVETNLVEIASLIVAKAKK